MTSHRHCARHLAAWAVLLLTSAPLLVGQSGTPPKLVERFSADSGLEWSESANPTHYFDAIGRRAAVFGKQDGKFEVWVWPIKVLHGFRLEFQLDNMPEPVRGENYLQRVVVKPESTTLVYAHPQFTVEQVIVAGDEQSAIVQLFDVSSDRPLAITAKFVPDFKPMWPASLGGQHTGWLDAEKAFTLSDGTGKPTAVIGSPATSANTEFMDHSLIGGEMLLRIATTPAESKHALYPLVITLSTNSEDEARSVYRDAVGRAREIYEKKAERWRNFLGTTLQITTPDPELNRAFTWAKVTIEQGWVCTAPPSAAVAGKAAPSVPPEGFAFPGDEPCGVVAGYGPAGEGERPGFAWWFGGDGMMSTWAMLDYGDFEGARRELRFLRAHQRSDGKMMHEMVQSTGIVDWWKNYHFAYMHADTTPMYLYSLGQYWQRTGDRGFLDDFWPSAMKAYQYCVSTLDPADGLMDNTKSGLGAIEVGVLRGKVTKDVYVQGFWVGGLRAMVGLAKARGDAQLAAEAQQRLDKALASLREHWRDPKRKYYAFGVNTDGERADLVGNFSAALMSVGGGVGPTARDDEEAVKIFALPEVSTDWGSRGVSNKASIYDPISYNNGTAWPYASGLVAWAQYANGQPLAGYQTLMSIAHLTGAQTPGGVPEHMSGSRNEPGARSVPHQLFSSWALIRPLVAGMLGLRDGPGQFNLAAALPASWSEVAFRNLRIHDSIADGTIRQTTGLISSELHTSVPLAFAPVLPSGTVAQRWALQSGRNSYQRFVLKGGIAVMPINPLSIRGESNSSLKMLGMVPDERTRTLTLELCGLANHSYDLDLLTSEPRITADGVQVEKTTSGYRLHISFGAGDDYVNKTITVRY